VAAENSESGADATTIGADVLDRNYQQRLTWPLTRIRKHFSRVVSSGDRRDRYDRRGRTADAGLDDSSANRQASEEVFGQR
jgi:hypothetical protein